MGYIKLDEVMGYHVDEQIFCRDCITKDELNAVKQDEVIVENDSDKNFIFCDRCKEQLAT